MTTHDPQQTLAESGSALEPQAARYCSSALSERQVGGPLRTRHALAASMAARMSVQLKGFVTTTLNSAGASRGSDVQATRNAPEPILDLNETPTTGDICRSRQIKS